MDTHRFEGRTVIITGGGTGIGRATAIRFAAEGAEVMLIGRRPEPLEQTQAQVEAVDGKAWVYACDVSVPDQVAGAVSAAKSRWAKIDVLVNNAGIAEDFPFLDIPVESWDRVNGTNLRAVFTMSQAVAREQVKSGGGAMVHLASISAHTGEINFASYCAAKSGLLNLSRSIATELGRYGIRSNCVSPGFTETQMLIDNVPANALDFMRHNFFRAPLNRIPTEAEVASAITFLASDDASGITGIDMLVDCGAAANMFLVETFPSEENTQ
jgi:NAD(P)-dependent dehydrogenase (short-subunit alcohol dehydrogenase family)